ncbi:MAG: polysaccharide pyruvyl transferase family protein [Planctomycetota bacterium]
MIVEIRGAGFHNKGAELMLRTTVSRLTGKYPDAQIAVEPAPGTPFHQRAKLGLKAIYPCYTQFGGWLRSLVIRSKALETLAFALTRATRPSDAGETLGLVDREDSHGLIDIAGYAYGDKFPAVRTRIAAEAAASYGRRGRPVVFMPQMFGPFEDPSGAYWLRKAAEHATLIYAREPRSLEMLRSLLGEDPRLRLCPDITIASLLPGEPIDDTATPDYACVVPNERMQDSGKAEWGDTYVTRLRGAIERIEASGIRPVLVIHTNDSGDRKIAEQLVADFGSHRVGLFDDPDPYELKRFLGGAALVVGSRFHSLVASLSLGVPAVALGWAHKYEMLAEDFGVPDLQHRGADDPSHLLSLVDRLLDADENARLRRTISERASASRETIEAMWDEVLGLLAPTSS